MKQFNARVLSNRAVVKFPGTTYHLMEIEYGGPEGSCRPGQFFMLQCGEDLLLRRPVSLHSMQPGKLHFFYAVQAGSGIIPSFSGQGLRWLAGRRKNDRVNLIGPLGNGFSLQGTGRNILIVSGGIGIAPLKYLAESALALKKKVTVLLGARTAAALYPLKLLPSAAKVVVATDDGSAGTKAFITDLLPEYAGKADSIYACGPLPMFRAMADRLAQCRYKKPVQVSLEVRMGCGFGVCYGCSIKTRQGMQRVCQEGPVFNIKDIIWQEVKV